MEILTHHFSFDILSKYMKVYTLIHNTDQETSRTRRSFTINQSVWVELKLFLKNSKKISI